MDQLEGSWPEKVLTMQRNWIGRSAGADVDFAIEGRDEPVTVYTTRPDTLFGATFMVVAADSELAAELVAGTPSSRPSSTAYLEEVRKASDIERLSTERPKTGVFLGPLRASTRSTASGIPIYAADYVLADYGTGAIMAVPAQDQRDRDFARGSTCRSCAPSSRPKGWEGEAVHRATARRSTRRVAGRAGRRRGQAPRSSTWLEQQGARARAP